MFSLEQSAVHLTQWINLIMSHYQQCLNLKVIQTVQILLTWLIAQLSAKFILFKCCF